MKIKAFYIFFIFIISGEPLHAADWTLTYNKQDHLLEADSFTGFQETCVKFAARCLEEKHYMEAQLKQEKNEPETLESSRTQELSFQIQDKDTLAQLFSGTPTLLQFETKKYMVELVELKGDQMRHEQNKLDTRFFNETISAQSQLSKFKIYLPLLDRVALIKEATKISLGAGKFVSSSGASLQEIYDDCNDIENSYKTFVKSVEKYTQLLYQGIDANKQGRFFYAKVLGIVIGINTQKHVQSNWITVEELRQLKQTLNVEYEQTIKQLR